MTFTLTDVPTFYQGYIQHVLGTHLIEELQKSSDEFIALFEGLTEQQSLYRYAKDKWSIKDLIMHLVDSERVFAYRAMCFARNDSAELPGFEQDDYVTEAIADRLPLLDLITSYRNVRRATIDLFASIDESEWKRSGVSNGVEMTVEMIGYIISGHTRHHHQILLKKYL